MAIQFSTELRNARLDAIETITGAAPTLRIRSGAPPANTAAARTGTILATIVLPSDWLANAASGSKSIAGGPWQDASADNSGTAGHFEIDEAGTIHIQGTVTATGGGGDMEVNNTNFAVGQPFSVTGFTLNEPNG